MNKKVVKCVVCSKLCSGKEAGEHKEETGHNKWKLLIPKEER